MGIGELGVGSCHVVDRPRRDRRHRRLQGGRGVPRPAEARARRRRRDDPRGGEVRRAGDLRGDHASSRDHVAVEAGHECGHRARGDRRLDRSAARGAVHGQRHRQVRERHRRRFPELALSGHPRARAAGARHEHEHAGARGGAAESAGAVGSRRPVRRAGRGLSGVRLDRQGAAGRAGRDRRGRGRHADARGVASSRPAHPRHRGADLRRHRSGALPRQPIERTDGICAGGRSAAAGRARHAGRRPDGD